MRWWMLVVLLGCDSCEQEEAPPAEATESATDERQAPAPDPEPAEEASPLASLGIELPAPVLTQAARETNRAALEKQRQDSDRRRFVGLLLEDKGVLRNHQRIVVDGVGEGEITSGGFSPTIGRSIALARVPAGDYERAQVDIRGKLLDVRVVKTPFVRNGQVRIDV